MKQIKFNTACFKTRIIVVPETTKTTDVFYISHLKAHTRI